jgi:lysophospholipase L1-like esterase
VENFGTSGARVRANFIELQQIEVKPGDFVIVYFGVNDAKVNNFFQKATRPLNLWPGYIQLLGFLRIKLNLQVANWIWLETVQPDFDRQLNRSKVGAETLLADLMKIHCFSGQTDSKFIAILQPHIFTKKTSDTFETNQKKKYASSLEKVISLQYKAYISSFSGFGWFQDFRHAFDTLDESPYLDWVHVNSSGNQRIAEEIFELVSKKD